MGRPSEAKAAVTGNKFSNPNDVYLKQQHTADNRGVSGDMGILECTLAPHNKVLHSAACSIDAVPRTSVVVQYTAFRVQHEELVLLRDGELLD